MTGWVYKCSMCGEPRKVENFNPKTGEVWCKECNDKKNEKPKRRRRKQ